MKIIVGDELGLIKCIDANKKTVESKYGEIKKNNSVLGIDFLFQNSTDLLSITHQEKFYILDWKTKTIKYNQLINETYTSQVVKKAVDSSTVLLSGINNTIDLFQFDKDLEITNYIKFDTELKNLFSLKNSFVENEIFCLSKKSPLQVYDINQNKITWKSKNVPHDELDLMVPIWDTDLTQNKSNSNVFYTSTAYGNVRVYDRKIKPKPIEDKNIFKTKINKITQTSCENYLIVGDTVGHMYLLDKRKNFHKVKCLPGFQGSIRDIATYENSPYVFSCGLDRYLRIHDYKKNLSMPHIYLKNKLNIVLPYEIDYKAEDDCLEYYEPETEKEKKIDDDMHELSDDPDLVNEENEKKKIPEIKKNSQNKKEDNDDSEDYEDSEGYEDDQDIDEENEEEGEDDEDVSIKDDISEADDELDLRIKIKSKKKNNKKDLLNIKPQKNNELRYGQKNEKNTANKKKKF